MYTPKTVVKAAETRTADVPTPGKFDKAIVSSLKTLLAESGKEVVLCPLQTGWRELTHDQYSKYQARRQSLTLNTAPRSPTIRD